ncbi:MAG: ACT domain-containing protein [Gammaproteobacteria bacterium]
MALLVLTMIGDDRPGLVDAVSGVITEHGGNWEESRMAHLANKFAGILLVSVADGRAHALAAALRGLQAAGLAVTVEDAADAPAASARSLDLELVGQDRPGIVHDIAHVLAAHRISIEDLETVTESASMAGGTLFRAKARLSVPAAVETSQLREVLEGLANELMVDIDLSEKSGN